MLDSLKALWISQDQTNAAQLPSSVLEVLKKNGFCGEFFTTITGLPIKQEYWKYVDFAGLAGKSFRFLPPKGANTVKKIGESQYEVVVRDLSQGARWSGDFGASLEPISEVISSDSGFAAWSSFFEKSWPSNFMSDLNRSFLYSGLALHVPRSKSLEVQVTYKIDGEENDIVPLHLIANVESFGSLKVSESFESSDFTGTVIYDKLIYGGEGSQIEFFGKERGSSKSHISQNTFVKIEKNGLWNGFDVTLPSLWSRHNTTAQMLGAGAQTNLFGLYLNDKDFFCDHHTTVEHLEPHTESKQIYKGVLSGTSEGVFNGKVFIAEGAMKSNSEQLNKNLLLSEKAEIHTKPELEIYNDDVKAAHGATVGQMDPEQLFYLLSRGFSRQQAWQAMCHSFTGDLFLQFSDKNMGGHEDDISEILTAMRPEVRV